MKVSGATHQGNVRTSNEDGMRWDEAIGFAAVADGMGGHQAGEVASSLALEALHNFLRRSAASNDFTWPYGISPSLSLAANRLMTGFKLANKRVFKQSEETPDYVGMGTTLVAVVLADGVLAVASVGDSRVYSFVDGALRQLTEDDSWLAVLSHEQGLTTEKLSHHPLRNVLTKVVGAQLDLDMTVQEFESKGQTILLASDGLYNALPEDVMRTTLCDRAPHGDAAAALVREALARDARDNVTAVVVEF
jgi:serine/threonine protein phosphatase PrpC